MPTTEEIKTESENLNPAQPENEDLNLAQPDAAAPVEADVALEEIPLADDSLPLPEGLNLQAYDDCGVRGRQPRIAGAGLYTFPEDRVKAGERARTVAFSQNGVLQASYQELDPNASYWLVLTYATEDNQPRRQRLTAGSTLLHGDRYLPAGHAERLVVELPRECHAKGRLDLNFVVSEGPNAVVSELELWSPRPAEAAWHIEPWAQMRPSVKGRVSGLRFEPVSGASVELAPGLTAVTDGEGVFEIDISGQSSPVGAGNLEFLIRYDNAENRIAMPLEDFVFSLDPYRPEAARVAGIAQPHITLDGEWTAQPADASGEAGRAFQVPGQLAQQGFGPTADSVFELHREFEVPADWEGARCFLRLEAVHGEAEYFLNGQSVGRSRLVYTPVELDVTKALQPGATNRLTVRLKTDPALLADRLASSSTYAHHNPSGIHRTVYLFALPPSHLASLRVQAHVDESLERGRLELDVGVESASDKPLELGLALRDPDGQALTLERERHALKAGEANQVAVNLEHPQLWSAETPRLYTVELTLFEAGEVVASLERRLGFRRVETRGSELLVNGRPVKLFGFNRHETDPLTGRTNTARHAWTDARLFKEANCNFLRTSHYPPTREFMEACDALGIYVEVEAPFCWTHQWSEENDPASARAFLEPTAAMFEWHQWHPSAIVWSLGNESGWYHDRPGMPVNYMATNAWLQEHDETRLTLFNNSWANDGGLCDIGVLHYPNPADIDSGLINPEDPRPILIDEWLHILCYNTEELDADPGIREEWAHGLNRFGRSDGLELWNADAMHNRIRRSERYLGIAVWAGIDELFELPNGEKHGYGHWGIIDGQRRTKPEWWHVRCMYSPIWLPERVADYDAATGRVGFAVENRHSFTGLDACEIRWKAGGESGRLQAPAIPALEQGRVEFTIPPELEPGSLLELEFFGSDGEGIVSWGLDLGPLAARELPQPENGAPELRREDGRLELRGEGFGFSLNLEDATLGPLPGLPAPALRELPSLHLTQVQRATRFNQNLPHYEVLPDATTRDLIAVEAQPGEQALRIVVRDRYAEFEGSTEFLIDRQGNCTASFDYKYSGQARETRELGLRVALREDCDILRWKRRGVWGVYPPDHIARLEGEAPAHVQIAEGQPVPWALEQDERGTRDFRSTKHRVLEASLTDSQGSGLQLLSNAEANIRAGMKPDGAAMLHLLVFDAPGAINPDDRVSGLLHLRLLP